MPIVLLGSTGMLGRAWKRELTNQSCDFDAPHCDILRIRSLGIGPGDTVINCVAYTDVDMAESVEQLAIEINGVFVGRLARHCEQQDAKLVHYSTDYVFDGEWTEYRPIHDPHPINAYGRSKFVGEKFLEFSGCKYLNIRTSWLYAPWGNNFVRTMLSLAEKQDNIKVVNDQFGRPTSCSHLVKSTMFILNQEGTWHITDGDSCSRFEFAQEIVGEDRVSPCKTAAMPRPAPRPRYSMLSTKESEDLLGSFPSWKSNLAGVLNEIAG